MASTSAPSSIATDAPISLEAVGYRYGDGQVALQGVSLTVAPGSITALCGENGSGKSTLLKLCAGRLKPRAGVLRWKGKVTPPFGSIGYVAQMPELDPDMTGLEHLSLMMALMAVPRALRAERARHAIATWQLTPFVSARVSSYSGGMRRRLHLALGIVHTPELWVLDEPSVGLDSDRQATLWREVRAHAASGGAVVIASHDLSAMAELSAQRIELARGQLV